MGWPVTLMPVGVCMHHDKAMVLYPVVCMQRAHAFETPATFSYVVAKSYWRDTWFIPGIQTPVFHHTLISSDVTPSIDETWPSLHYFILAKYKLFVKHEKANSCKLYFVTFWNVKKGLSFSLEVYISQGLHFVM